ncbi:unnamed protein product, partial [Angiostrongylus costaricensis]|uniref:ABC transmembrane type-1 domain-containing protein n=1 Tax=Angiostrongylus costaricensis TaxID=334426 RepID=A0A0R3PZK6_ANGCS
KWEYFSFSITIYFQSASCQDTYSAPSSLIFSLQLHYLLKPFLSTDPCHIFLSKFVYASSRVLMVFIVLSAQFSQIAVLIERCIATVLVQDYESKYERIGPSLITAVVREHGNMSLSSRYQSMENRVSSEMLFWILLIQFTTLFVIDIITLFIRLYNDTFPFSIVYQESIDVGAKQSSALRRAGHIHQKKFPHLFLTL